MTRATKPPVVRFMAKVDKTGSCWQWLGAKQAGGYGRFGAGEGRLVLAHRWSYEHHVGPIADGMTIDHLCRNTSCVNPAHMEVVTREVNAYRGNPNSTKTHCKHGHEFTPANTYIQPSRPHVRGCMECRRASNEARKLARAERGAA